MKVFTIGRSEEGREILMLAVADETGIRDLDRLKAATAALADPRRTDPAAAERLIETGRPLYYLNAVLHADETGSTEAMLELAYRLAVSEQPMIRRIRQEVVVLINPVSNPDGRDRVVEWFYRFLKGKTDYGALPRQSPPYWSNYAFVDINRDAHQQVHQATKAVHRMFHEWHPTVVHDLHEAIALLLTWNGTGPYNPHIDPITHGEFLEMAFGEVRTMTAFGMPGVSTWKFGEAFGHHYLDSVAMNHNSLGRGYETWGNATAETVRRTIDASDATMEWYRPLPPPREFTWSARDNVNYTQTGALAALDHVARNAKEMLRNFYQKGWNSWRKGVEQAPYAFVIPEDQGDRLRVAQMVGRLLDQRIEVSRAKAPLSLKEGRFPAGSYVVRLDQPYRNYAVDLLTPQRFPKDGGEPYDDISWELPAHYRLEAIPIADASWPRPRRQARPPSSPLVAGSLTAAPRPAGSVGGAGPVFVLKDTGQEALLAARYRLSGFRAEVATRAFRAAGTDFPAGSWVLPAQDGLGDAVRATAAELGLDFTSAPTPPDVPRRDAPAPRLGVWVPWADTDSIGWIRYALDQRRVPYVYVRDEDVRAGPPARALRRPALRPRGPGAGRADPRPAEALGPDALQEDGRDPEPRGARRVGRHHGRHRLGGPRAASALRRGRGAARHPRHGKRARPGRRHRARRAPRRRAACPAAATAEGRRPRRPPRARSRAPRARTCASRFARPDHPLAYGYPARTHVFRQNFPLYDAPRRWLRMAYCTSCLDGPEDRSGVVLEWGDREGAPLVVSGQAWGEAGLVGRPAILDLPAGRGRVVAFNFNPLHRDLNRGDHRLVWNAILQLEGDPRRRCAKGVRAGESLRAPIVRTRGATAQHVRMNDMRALDGNRQGILDSSTGGHPLRAAAGGVLQPRPHDLRGLSTGRADRYGRASIR